MTTFLPFDMHTVNPFSLIPHKHHTGPDDPLFIDLSSLKVVGRLRVQHEDDTPLTPGEGISCVNMMPESLWGQINCFVSGVPVSGLKSVSQGNFPCTKLVLLHHLTKHIEMYQMGV